jgi:uncharacterized membrane protein
MDESRHLSSGAAQLEALTRFDIRPNCSLTPRGTWVFLGTAGLACLGPALVLVTQGFWPVLPFAGLEFGVLAAATWWSLRKGRYREVIIIRDSTVSVEKFGPASCDHWQAPVHWCRATLLPEKSGGRRQKLLLQTGLQSCEVASCCTDSERVRLWQRLHGLIGPINQTPQSRTATFNRVEPDSNQEVGTHVQ